MEILKTIEKFGSQTGAPKAFVKIDDCGQLR